MDESNICLSTTEREDIERFCLFATFKLRTGPFCDYTQYSKEGKALRLTWFHSKSSIIFFDRFFGSSNDFEWCLFWELPWDQLVQVIDNRNEMFLEHMASIGPFELSAESASIKQQFHKQKIWLMELGLREDDANLQTAIPLPPTSSDGPSPGHPDRSPPNFTHPFHDKHPPLMNEICLVHYLRYANIIAIQLTRKCTRVPNSPVIPYNDIFPRF
jgi:hypothetical protein